MEKEENKIQLAQKYIDEINQFLDISSKQNNKIVEQYKRIVSDLEIPELSSFFLIKFAEYLDIETYCKLESNVINKGELELAIELANKVKIKKPKLK